MQIKFKVPKRDTSWKKIVQHMLGYDMPNGMPYYPWFSRFPWHEKDDAKRAKKSSKNKKQLMASILFILENNTPVETTMIMGSKNPESCGPDPGPDWVEICRGKLTVAVNNSHIEIYDHEGGFVVEACGTRASFSTNLTGHLGEMLWCYHSEILLLLTRSPVVEDIVCPFRGSKTPCPEIDWYNESPTEIDYATSFNVNGRFLGLASQS